MAECNCGSGPRPGNYSAAGYVYAVLDQDNKIIDKFASSHEANAYKALNGDPDSGWAVKAVPK